MTHTRRLLADAHADAAGASHLSGVLGGVTTAELARRRVTGLVLPWGRFGNTSAGRLAVRPGAVRLPDDLSRVKLVDDHHRPPVSVGYAIAAERRADGLYMTFQLGRSDRATDLLEAMEDKTKDGLSVELDELEVDGSLVTDSLLTAVAGVAVPAFSDARVTDLAAAYERNEMDCLTCGTRHPVTAACAAPALTATSDPTTPAHTPAPTAPPQEVPAPQDPPAEDPPAENPTRTEASRAPATTTPAAAPTMLAGHAPAAPATMSAVAQDAEVYAALGRVARGESNPMMEAALADITNTSVYDVVGQESYVGRLWDGNTYRRRFVALLRQAPLTSYKIRGWRWGVRPEVGDYAGDKADVPSNTPTLLPAETEAARLAGGHDLDRKFVDFNDTEFIQAYLQAMTESYAKKSDAKALAFILAAAAADAPTATAAGANLIQAAITAENALVTAFDDDGIQADWVLVNREDRMGLLEVTNNEAPAYANALGFDFSKMIGTSSVASGTVVAGVRNAGTFYELGGSPVRVSAVDIARGGVDEALFGYYATLLNDARGIQRVTITA